MTAKYVRPGNTQQFFSAGEIHREKKAWGEEQWIVNSDYCGKKLILKCNRRCSLHLHKEKDEVFYLQSGLVKLELAGKTYTMHPGDFVHIRPGQEHRFTGIEDSEIVEFSTHHVEEDSYRKEFSGHADPERYARQESLLKAFAAQKILVIGDVMLDRYTHGHVGRISPEAPVPVLHVRSRNAMPGGAANSAAGIAALGAQVMLVGVVGQDDAGKTLAALLKKENVAHVLLSDTGRPTTVKERIVGNEHQQMLRIDAELTDPLSSALEQKLIAAIIKAATKATGILISDYAKGVLTPAVLDAVRSAATKNKIPFVMDPKPCCSESLASVRGATAITPNAREARLLLGETKVSEEDLGKKLSAKMTPALILTRGEHGIDVCVKGKKLAHFDALSPAIVDVSGAGDTVAVVVALALAAGGSLEDAADMGNRAAGLAVRKPGACTVSAEELDAAL